MLNSSLKMVERGTEVRIQYEELPASSDYINKLSCLNIETIIAPTHGGWLMSMMRALTLYFRYRPDHIITHFVSSPHYVACMAYKVIFPSTRLTGVFHLTPRMRRWSIARLCLTRFKTVVATSDAVASRLIAVGVPTPPVYRRYLGIFKPQEAINNTIEGRHARREELGIRDDQIVVCCALFDHPVKGPDVLLAGFARARSLNSNLLLLIIGIEPDGRFEELCEALGIPGDAIKMTGIIDSAMDYFAVADIYVQPSRAEALSLSIVEASALGLPTVASRVGGIPEVVREGKSGLLFDAEDIDGFAKSINRLANDSELRAAYGRRAQQHYRDQFDGYRNLNETIALINR